MKLSNSGWNKLEGQPKILPNMGVVVGIPSSRNVAPEWAIALAVQAWPSNTNVCYVPIHCGNPRTGTEGPPRDKARELIVEAAQQLKAPYIWFIDDDVEVPYGACRQLLRTLKEAPDEVCAVGGIYPEKNDPPAPIVYTTNGHGPDWRWKRGTIFEASLIGTGCMMVKTEVFSHISKPWFKDVNEGMVNVTDDAWFVMKAHEAGYKFLADANVICPHWDYERMIRYEIPADSYPMKVDEAKVDITEGLPSGWMTAEELLWLTAQAKEKYRIVEVGSYLGRSTVAMARSTQGEVWALDNFKAHDIDVPDRGSIYERFVENTKPYQNIHVIQMDHEEASKIPIEWLRGSPQEKPDMVFIDGDHGYSAVKRDLQIWKARIAPGGLLCGHDLSWPGVSQALKEECPEYRPAPGDLWTYSVPA